MQIHHFISGKTIRYRHVCVYRMWSRELNFVFQNNIRKNGFLTETIFGIQTRNFTSFCTNGIIARKFNYKVMACTNTL